MSWNPPVGPFAKPPEKKKSYWFWWVCLGLGIASFVGFIILAFKIQTRKFVVAAVVAIAASAAAFAAVELDPTFDTATSDSSDTTGVSDVGFGFWVVVAIWAGLVVYALFLLPEVKRFLESEDAAAYARWNTTRGHAQGYYSQPVSKPRVVPPPYVPPVASPAPPSATREDSLAAETDRYLAIGPSGNTPRPTPPNVPE